MKNYCIFFALLSMILSIYSCADLQKIKQIAVQPRDEIAELYYREALLKLNEKDISEALTLLLRAKSRSPRNPKIKKELTSLISSLESETYYRDEVIQKGSGLSSPLQYILYYKSGNKRYPVSNIPVYFTFLKGYGILTEDAITNDLGIAKCYVEEITDFERMIIIEAAIILEIHEEKVFLDSLTREYVYRDISIFDIPHVIIVHVEKSSYNNPPDLCEEMTGLFRAHRFSDVKCHYSKTTDLFQRALLLDKPSITLLKNETQSDIIVMLNVKSSFVMRQSIDFYLSDASAEIKFIDTHTFLVQFEENATERGAGQSSEESEYRAILSAIRSLNKKANEYLSVLRRRNGF